MQQAAPSSIHQRRWYFYLLYYGVLALLLLAGILYGLVFSDPALAGRSSTWFEKLMLVLKLSWLVPLPYVIINFYAYIRYPVAMAPSTPDDAPALDVKLYFRFVTRGRDAQLSLETARSARHILEAVLPPEAWRIEVVSDNPLPIGSTDGRVRLIVVPADYRPPAGARYKARALHYAINESAATDDDWIIHLDEETHFDEDTVRAIAHFVAGQAGRPQAQRCLGQGVVLYGRHRVVNWLTTLADSLRVGDDYGRFRLQYENGKAVFGMHGSFLVVNNAVERAIGFDFGFAGSITEDAFFALMLQAAGGRFAFIPGYMYEESPFTFADFVRQRRRWFGGLWLCATARALPLKDRSVLIAFMITWALSWPSLLISGINVIAPTATPLWVALPGGVFLACYVLLYLVGFFRTFPGRLSRGELVLRFFQQVLFLPIFSFMEACGVLYGIVSPPKDFYVVQKSAQAAAPAGVYLAEGASASSLQANAVKD